MRHVPFTLLALAPLALISTPAAAALPAGYTPPGSLAPLINTLQPAVVNISVKSDVTAEQMNPFPFPMPIPPGMNQPHEVKGEGSGFILSGDGYILTNNHVVDNAKEVKVTLSDDRIFIARVIGTDERTDVALVKIDTKDELPHVTLGSSRDAQVGDFVIAIGQPFGLSHTVTSGIISAKSRVIGAGPYDDFIQTDASINPGNSGGPLYNGNGEVIGINTAISANGQGIGFAVPIDMVKPLIDELRNNGKVARGWMGVSLAELDIDGAKQLGAPSGGVAVSQVGEGVPGKKAGLTAGDVITSVDGTPVKAPEEVVRMIGLHHPGDKIKLSVIHDGKPKTIEVTLGERPSEKELLASAGPAPQTGPSVLQKLGISLDDTKVVAVEADSPAAGKLRAGDVIVQVGSVKVKNGAELTKALTDARGFVTVFVQRDGEMVFVPIRLSE